MSMNYKKDFKMTRIIILLPLLPAAISAVLGLVTDDIFWGYAFAGAAVLFAIFHVALWRCPECKSYMGRGLSIPGDGRCPMCRKLIAEPVQSGEKAKEIAEKAEEK